MLQERFFSWFEFNVGIDRKASQGGAQELK